MSLFLKIFSAVIALLILVVGGAALYLFTVFDANDYKAEIQSLAKQHSQLELNIDGDLQLSVFPWLGVSVENISIDSHDEHLASASYARIFAKFAPLLKGELEIDGIALRDFKLQLIKDAKGRGNWQLEPSSKNNAKSTSASSDLASLPLAAFVLGYLEIENADVSYQDLATGSDHQFQNLDFTVNNVSFRSAFPVTANFSYLNSELKAPVLAHLTSQVSLDIGQEQLTLTDTVLDVDNTRIHTNLEVQQLLKSPVASGRITITEFNPSHWAGIFRTPALADMAIELDLKSDLQFDSNKGQFTLKNLTLRGPQLDLIGDINTSSLDGLASYQGQLDINTLKPGSLLSTLGFELATPADEKTLNSLTGQIQFSGTNKSLQLPKINLQLDDSKLQGNLKFTDFNSMASSFSLNVDSLDLDRYLPAKPPSEQDNQSTSPNALLLPLAALRNLNTNGRLHIGKLIASGHQIDNLDANVVAYNGFINLKSLTGNLYGGSMKATASIDARNNTPQINFNKRFTGIQATPLLTSLAKVDYLAGTMDLQINGSAFGNTLPAIKRSLSGEADFNVRDGMLKNTNIEQLVCKSIARIRDRQYSVVEEEPNTRFKEFNGHMNIVKGVMQTDQLQLALSNLQINGSGVINLLEQSLDYKIRAKILGDLENQACEVHERYRNVAWPLHCQGSLNEEPSKLCGLDQRELQNIAAQLAQQEIKRKTGDQIDNKLKEKLGDEATQQLKDLFGL